MRRRTLPRLAAFLLALSGGAAASCTFDSMGLGPAAATGGAGGAGGVTSSSTGAGGAGGATSSSTGGAASSSSTGGGPGCGDGIVQPDEECDDGNTVSLDGCASTCLFEHPETCPGTPVTVVPPGITVKGDPTGKGDELDPRCGADGKADVVYAVTPTVSGTLAITLANDVARSLSVRTRCEDGPTSELTCKEGDQDLTQSLWVYAGQTYFVVVDGDDGPFTLTLALTECGDGVTQGLEECDDALDATCVGCFHCAGQDEHFDPVSKHCYRYGGSKKWREARDLCVAWGGDLVGIGSKAEYDFLLQSVVQNNDVWTGGNDLGAECSFGWVNGERWWPQFYDGEPNNAGGAENCVTLKDSESFRMNDDDCNGGREHVCERAPGGACGDGIVQPGEECDGSANCVQCKVQCKAGEFMDPSTQHCYFVSADEKSWESAKTTCGAAGGYLAVITSEAERDLILPHVTVDAWLGGELDGGHALSWVNLDATCYQPWGSGQPDWLPQYCVRMIDDGTWDNEYCSSSRAYVCERDP